MPRSLSLLLVCLTLGTPFAAAADKTSRPHPPSMLVQTDWLAAHLQDKNLVLLHVGVDRKAYDAGHIPGAQFLAMSEIAITRNGIPNELPPAGDLKTVFERLGVGDRSRVVLYGDRLNLFATRAYFTLDYLGQGKIAAILDGGFEKWAREHEMSKAQPPAAIPGKLTITPHPELVIEMASLKPIVEKQTIPLIDARPPEDYAGAGAGEGLSRGGHISGAKNVFWTDTLVGKDNPVFKSVEEIKAKYEAVGVKPGGKAIVYCRTGVQASHDYFSLKLAGFRPVLYDGSMIEWANAPDTPVQTDAIGIR